MLQNGESALHGAALFGHLGCVKLLVAAGSDIKLRNQSGLTAYQLAVTNQKCQIVTYFRNIDTSLNCVSKSSNGLAVKA